MSAPRNGDPHGLAIDPDIRRTVEAELPELADIASDTMRGKVADAWSFALGQEGLLAISDLDGCGSPGRLQLKSGTQLDHIRGVTRMALATGLALRETAPDLPLDTDVLVAGGILHDVGKPFEFNRERRSGWHETPNASGFPAARHPAHGWHICLTVGLPEAVAHIAGAHSHEGEYLMRSLECTLVHHADFCYWKAMRVSGLLKDGPLG